MSDTEPPGAPHAEGPSASHAAGPSAAPTTEPSASGPAHRVPVSRIVTWVVVAGIGVYLIASGLVGMWVKGH